MNNRNLRLMSLDIIASLATLYAAFLLRFEFSIPGKFISIFIMWAPWFALTQVLVFYFGNLYARIWRYTSLFDLYAIIRSTTTASAISFIVIFMGQTTIYPRSVLLLYYILNTVISVAIRLSVRVYYTHYHEDSPLKNPNPKKLLLLIGAGRTGEKIAKEIMTTSRGVYSIVGFVDDSVDKHGALLHGKPIFGNINELVNINQKYDELLITAPSVSGDKMRRIVDICKKTGKPYKIVPAISEIIDGEITMDAIRDVSYADLLGREEVKLDFNSIVNIIKGKRVLITGAGGSIGNELVKQCLNFEPAEIICLDTSEEKIYKLDQFANTLQSKTVLKNILASINIKSECEKVFSDNRPHIVFHAAAYKHVPIQELHPWTAVNTNLGGTLNIVELSHKYSVDKFVLVSTDKAVNPVNIMGATKRGAEKLIQSFNTISQTTYIAVRFGNVLGSSGSAIPTFQKQINDGGPITITHPEMTRYFMSIQEASQLILQCGALGKDGEIFLLEMGKPIRIMQMAKDLIRLSGLEPEIDIPIVFTGLRPGEKLYEELQLFNEQKVKTKHRKIMILKDKKSNIPWPIMRESIKEILHSASELDSEKIQTLLKQIIPTYVPRDFVGPKLDQRDSSLSKPRIKAEA